MRPSLIERFEAQYIPEPCERLREALRAAKISHRVMEGDCWFSCPKSGQCCNDEADKTRCDCGADEHNAKIDAALAAQPPAPSGPNWEIAALARQFVNAQERLEGERPDFSGASLAVVKGTYKELRDAILAPPAPHAGQD